MKKNIQLLRKLTQLTAAVLMALGLLHFSPAFLAMVLVSACFFGPLYCGWICPFGFLQELIGKIGSFIRKKTGIRIPQLPAYSKYFRLGFVAGILPVLPVCSVSQSVRFPEPY